MFKQLTLISTLLAVAKAQQACTLTTETKPNLNWSKCTASGCQNVQGKVVVDSNWRWTHTTTGATNCYDGNQWTSACTDPVSCAANCCVDGADYSGTYGITTSGDSLNLKFVTQHSHGKNVGGRVYLMENENKYQMFNLLGNEFTFDVDVSNLPCGLNGALYFVSMDADGGLSKYSGNNAGAKYGTGYCDSQCPRDLKWIAGKANVAGWTPSLTDENTGVGNLGACCTEMDIWEANSQANAYTPHTCDTVGYTTCTGDNCGGTYSDTRYAGTCDPDGCDFNPWRQGNQTYYGTGSNFVVDTTKKMTVVTQFHTDSSGAMSEIRRLYVQDGKVIQNSQSLIAGNPGDSLTKNFCNAQKAAFDDPDPFNAHGGWDQMSTALETPMVLVLSLWDDGHSNMLWLDSTYPIDSTKPGASRGPCPTNSGVPSEVRQQYPDANVVFSNIKFGPIGSTYSGGSNPPPSSSTTTTQPSTSTTSTPPNSSTPGGSTVPRWGQCGGQGYTGPTTCQSPWTCQKLNDWYSQCQ